MSPRSPRWLALSLAAAMATSGCCKLLDELDDPRRERRRAPADDDDEGAADTKKRKPPAASDERIDLGTAEHPEPNDAPRVEHPFWLPKLEPKHYRLGYKLHDNAAADIHRLYQGWAQKVGHRKIDENRFQWRPPQGCHGGLHCVYDLLDDGSAPGVEPIARLFRRRAAAARLDAEGLTALVVTFVQEIQYEIPEDEPFGVLPPALVVKRKKGDCDSKTLLAHMLLRSLGIRSVLISSDAHKHTMLGVAIPSAGQSFTHRGTKYAFVELTAQRSPIGHINPKLLRPNDWRVVSMQYKPLGQPPQASDAPRDAEAKPQPKPRRGGAAYILGGGKIKSR